MTMQVSFLLKRVTGSFNRRRGITLIELLVVIAVLGVLGALLFPALLKFRDKGLDARCMGNLRQVGSAFMSYVNDNSGSFFPDYPDGRPDLRHPNQYVLPYLGLPMGADWNVATYNKNSVFNCPKVSSIKPAVVKLNTIYGFNWVLMNSVGGPPYVAPGYKGVVPHPQWPIKLANVSKPGKMYICTEASLLDADRGFNATPVYSLNSTYFDAIAPGKCGWPHNGRKNFVFLDGHVESLSFNSVRELIKDTNSVSYKGFNGYVY